MEVITVSSSNSCFLFGFSCEHSFWNEFSCCFSHLFSCKNFVWLFFWFFSYHSSLNKLDFLGLVSSTELMGKRGSCCQSNHWIFTTKRIFICCHKDRPFSIQVWLKYVNVFHPLIPLTLSQMQWMVGFCQQFVDCSSSRIFFPNKIINFKFRVNLSPSRTIIFLLLSSELYFCWAHYHSWHFIASLPPKRILFFFHNSEIPCFFWIIFIIKVW